MAVKKNTGSFDSSAAIGLRHPEVQNRLGSDSVLKNEVADFKGMGQRIFVFIIGGATPSERRACQKLKTKLKRESVLVSTSFDDPLQYVTKLKLPSEKILSKGGPVLQQPNFW